MTDTVKKPPKNNFFLRHIDEGVFLEARARCLLQGRKLGELVTELLRDWLKKSDKPGIYSRQLTAQETDADTIVIDPKPREGKGSR